MRMNASAPAIRVTETPEKEDIGFYARVPRIVRTGYQELSHAEKWLYTCLRDLCGEAGECWRSLRSLAKETGISIASLSTMIPHLAKVGLIDAVMKSTWFIRIKNIWQANKEYCSKIEHSAVKCSENEHGVQNMNADCSENEQGCSEFEPKKIESKKIDSEEDNSKKIEDISITIVNADELRPYIDGYPDQSQVDLLAWIAQETNKRFSDIPPSLPLTPAQEAKLYTSYAPYVDTDTMSHSHVSATGNEAVPAQEQPRALQSALHVGATSPPTRKTRKLRQNKKVVEEKPVIQLTEQQQAFWLLWCDIWFNQDIPPELNETAYKHIVKLAPHIRTKEQLESRVTHARKEMEARGIKRKTVYLGNLVSSHAGWMQAQRPDAEAGGYIINGKHYKQLPYDYCIWQGQVMLKEQANDLGWNGGFERYK